ncbi:MAG: preprotein translocase subunit YajC [Rhodospirillales bacterium]|nr:preprotein translocase subunit YajC [Rhodospirillales bacterium]
MLISTAYAAADAGAQAGGAGEAFMLNMLLIVMMIALFWVLMIMPQQKRFKKHRAMLDTLKKGDKVVFAGGLVGKVDKIKEGEEEISIELAKGVNVMALRSTVQTKAEKD